MADAKAPAANPYQAAADTDRAVAKWLIGAYAAVGAALLAGLQLTGLGALSGLQLGFAILAVLAAAGGILAAVLACTRVLTPITTNVNDLNATWIATKLDHHPLLRGYVPDAAGLVSVYNTRLVAYHAAWAAQGAYTKASRAHQKALRAQDDLKEIDAVVNDALGFANWLKIDRSFSRARTPITIGSAVALIGMVAFAYLANRTAPFTPGAADSTPTRLVRVSFSADAAPAWRPVLGTRCDLAHLGALIVATDAGKGQVELVSLPTTDCTARHFTIESASVATLSDTDVSVPVDLKAPPK